MGKIESPAGIISVQRLFTTILSVSIHMLVFLVPIPMAITPQIQEMELFVTIEDIRAPRELAKTQREMEKPRAEPVNETNIQAEVPRPQIREPEIIRPDREDSIEPVREVKKEPGEEVKKELTRIESNSTNKAESENEFKKEPVEKIEDEKPTELESYSVNQPAADSIEALFVPPVSNIPEKNIDAPIIRDGAIWTRPNVENQQPVSHGVAGIDASSQIETRFGASVAPAFLHKEMPVYPMIARKLGREGKVVLKLTIDEKGNLLHIEVIERADYGFTEAAVEAVKKSTFLPAKKDGKPIASRALLPIKFRLERN